MDPNPFSVISSDHADDSLNTSSLLKDCSNDGDTIVKPRKITKEEVRKSKYLVVIDGYVINCFEFLKEHPGGIKKILATNQSNVGATGKEFGFSFTRGKNAHFSGTGKDFKVGIKKYLNGKVGKDGYLEETDIHFKGYDGKIKIIGILK